MSSQQMQSPTMTTSHVRDRPRRTCMLPLLLKPWRTWRRTWTRKSSSCKDCSGTTSSRSLSPGPKASTRWSARSLRDCRQRGFPFREFQCLIRITAVATAGAASGVSTRALGRIPRLLGIVRSSDHGDVIGLSETFVPHMHPENPSQGSLDDTDDRTVKLSRQTLYFMDLPTVSIERRERWIHQIEETIAAIHRLGVTWYDVKAGNVVINSVTDDAWLIDLWVAAICGPRLGDAGLLRGTGSQYASWWLSSDSRSNTTWERKC